MKLKVRRSKDVNIYTSLVGLFNLQRYDKLSAALVL